MTDYLYARPSFLEGMGRTIDLFGVLNRYNTSQNSAEADRIALTNDWLAVYKDLRKAYVDTLCQIETKKTAV